MRPNRLLPAALALALAGGLAAADLVIVHTNDLHGYVFPREFAGDQLPEDMLGRRIGSLFSASTYVRWLRSGRLPGGKGRPKAEKPAGVLFLDAGDWFGGTLYGEVTRGVAIGKILADHRLGIDATTFGNHAWDFGTPALREFRSKLRGRVPVLVANARYKGKAVADPYKIFQVGDRKIGVLGLVTDGALRASTPENTKGWTIGNELEALQRWVPELREKCDYVILLSHIGYGRDRHKRQALDELDNGHPEYNVDLVVDGHSHRNEDLWVDEDTFVAQADHYGLRLGEIRIPLLEGGGFGKPRAKRVVLESKRFPLDRSMISRHSQRIAARNEVEGEVVVPTRKGVKIPHLLRTDQRLVSKMADLVCAAFLRAAEVEGKKADFAVAYHNGVRSGLYATPRGGITAGGLHAVSPFGGPVTVVEVKGKKFQGSALRRAYLTRNRMSFGNAFLVAREDAKGKRSLVSFEVEGKAFDPDRRYRIVMDDFMQGWFRGKDVKRWHLKATPKTAVRDLLLDAAKGKPLTQSEVDRLSVPSAELRKD